MKGQSAHLAACPVLVGLVLLSAFALPSYNYINADVAFLAWAADQVLGPPVYGADILDVNPPLSMLIYMPAALLVPMVGFEWGIRLWMLVLTILSISVLWQTADKSLRLPVTGILMMFILLAFPNHFGQREQIALLLCAPYVAGSSSRRHWGFVSGVMAGTGFIMKPHFLIPLAFILATRRKFGIEERVILATGVAYSVVLITFFQAYLFQMMPAAFATYWAISLPWKEMVLQTVFISLVAGSLALAAAPQSSAQSYLMATVGFLAAAILQGKGFHYHFIPAFGFLAMYVTATVQNQKRLVSAVSIAFLVVLTVFLGRSAKASLSATADFTDLGRELRAEIDSSESFVALSAMPAAAFPAAIRSPSRYAGIAICQIFIPAVVEHLAGAGKGDSAAAERLALDQATRELRNEPDLVIVVPANHDGSFFDLLSWLKQDEEFRDLWKDYHHYRTIAHVTLYRRK